MTREDLIQALGDAKLPIVDVYVDDSMETQAQRVADGKEPWPIEIFVALARHRQAVVRGEPTKEIEQDIWHLQGNEGEPGLTEDERRRARAAFRHCLNEAKKA